MVALSLALHGAAFASIARARRSPARERIEIEVVRRERPQAAPAPPPKPRSSERKSRLTKARLPPGVKGIG